MKASWQRARCFSRASFAPGLVALALGFLGACAPRPGTTAGGDLGELRHSGAGSSDETTLARWLLAELISPGGTALGASQARARLDATAGKSYLAELGRGLDDGWHGRLEAAPDHFLRALGGASQQATPESRLVAWFAAAQAVALAQYAPELWSASRGEVEALIAQPLGIGWRARALLVQWWLDEESRRGQAGVDERSVERLGCVTAVRLAGPFGSPAPVHLQRSFPPEVPGPWPRRWATDPDSGIAAKVLASTQRGCEVVVDETVAAGVFYAEAFFELQQPEDVILAAQGALALWVDDRQVLSREPLIWGAWPKFGIAVRLSAGRHRVLARLSEPRTLLRAMHLDGTPLVAKANADTAAPYELHAPEVLADPNDLMRFVAPDGVRGEPDDVTRLIAAQLAHLEGEDDIASVLVAPLTEPVARATGPVLASLGDWVGGDPLFGRAEATDQTRSLYEAAVQKDPGLWRAQLGLVLAKANAGSLAEAVAPLRKLAERFPDVPAIYTALSIVLGRLDWEPEQRRVVLDMAERFGDLSSLAAAVSVHEQRGDDADVKQLLGRIVELDGGSEIVLDRALARRDYAAALTELDRLGLRQPYRRSELERRRQQIRLQMGDRRALDAWLASVVQAAPENGPARLAWADARYAAGDAQALHAVLAEATQAGADTRALEQAIDTVEAQSDFEPLRLDGREVIRAYEALGKHQSATAARVLDYSAVWIHSDGSSRMLEHEIVRIQSSEGIEKFAEHPKLEGLVLNMRVIKRDGRTLEPEPVAGKPTVTFPHLEVGDYIETEHVQGFPAAEHGQHYPGMRWFFREEDVAYARSEFVLIAPEHRPLDIEITGEVPDPVTTHDGLLVTRRWRVENSPAAPVEPLSPPVQEFLPSVRTGWGNGIERRLRLLSEQVADTVPIDPRIATLAHSIVPNAGELPELERARKAYRWVQDNVKDGEEADGRKALSSKQGNRWSALRMLLRALDVPVRYLLVKNRLAPPGLGPMSDAEAFNVPLLQIGSADNSVWLSLQEQFAPFGYVPVEARGMPGRELSIGTQKPVVVPAIGDQDRLEYEGSVQIDEHGGALLTLNQRFLGKYAMRLRAGLEQVPEGRLHEVLETRLLGQALPGAELTKFTVLAQKDLDAPLVVEMQGTVGNFAEVRSDRIVIEPPLMPRLTRLAALPERQTPLLIREAMHQSAKLTIRLKPGTRVWGAQDNRVVYGEYTVVAKDRVTDDALILDREVSIPAGRVSPADYAQFVAFTRDAERLLSQPLVLGSGIGDADPRAK